MSFTLTDFGIDDLIGLIIIIDLFINFTTLLFYEVVKDYFRKEKK